jgi:hypothetical protein
MVCEWCRAQFRQSNVNKRVLLFFSFACVFHFSRFLAYVLAAPKQQLSHCGCLVACNQSN